MGQHDIVRKTHTTFDVRIDIAHVIQLIELFINIFSLTLDYSIYIWRRADYFSKLQWRRSSYVSVGDRKRISFPDIFL